MAEAAPGHRRRPDNAPGHEVKHPLVRAAHVPPMAQDAALAAALFAVTFGPGRLEGATGPILQAALVLPLVWRRRAPLTMFSVIAAVALAQWLLGIQLPADAALLIALGTVTARSPWRHALLAGVVLETGAVMSAARWAPEGRFLASAAALTAAVAACVLLGANARIRRAAQEDHITHLERERDHKAQLAVGQERARIAREIHDSVTHNLSVIVALADALVHTRPDDTLAVTEQIAETGRQALTDMRRSLGILQDGEPDAERHPLPGIAQLGLLCDQMRAVGLPTRLWVDDDLGFVPAAAQLTAYRIVQESLTNTLKHAPAGTRAEVRVSCSSRAVTVEVTDDGPAAPAATPGRGIAGMRERAAAYSGALHAGPLPGRGWQVSARLVLSGTP
jgi:signal transduction histidine kinase